MLISDSPILKSKEDKLNRKKFTEDLARAINELKTDDCFVIGLYGKWGSGKTSVLNMIIERLEELKTPDTVIMGFNPWLCADPNQLISQFF